MTLRRMLALLGIRGCGVCRRRCGARPARGGRANLYRSVQSPGAVGTANFFNTTFGDVAVGVELDCPGVVPPTAPPTATATMSLTPTITDTPTITATPTITRTPTITPTGLTVHACSFGAPSRIDLHLGALPVPLSHPLIGIADIAVGAPDLDGRSVAGCQLRSVTPTFEPGIGYLCVEPVPDCAAAVRDCDGGDPLGIDVQADGDIGACTGNAQCQASCNAHCAGLGAVNTITGTGCSGFCSAGAMSACTADADCQPEDGTCNGRDPIGADGGICQCTCIDSAAGAPSPPGALQCTLGARIAFETLLPCGDGDVLVPFGEVCIALTTETAGALVTDANFVPGATVPASPVALTGSEVQCATLDGSVASGMRLVGATTVVNPVVGDTAIGFGVNCQ
jgi:hypothetical protein